MLDVGATRLLMLLKKHEEERQETETVFVWDIPGVYGRIVTRPCKPRLKLRVGRLGSKRK